MCTAHTNLLIAQLSVIQFILLTKQVTNPYSLETKAALDTIIALIEDDITNENAAILTQYPQFNQGIDQCICGAIINKQSPIRTLRYHCNSCKGSLVGFRHIVQYIAWQLSYKLQGYANAVRIEALESLLLDTLEAKYR